MTLNRSAAFWLARLSHARPNALDEHADDRAQCAVSQGDDRDWPRACRHFHRQRLEREALLVEAQDRIWKGGYVPTRGQEVDAKVKRKRHDRHLRHLQPSGTERFFEEKAIPGVRWCQNPWLIYEVGEANSPATGPGAFCPHRDDQPIVEKNIDFEVVQSVVGGRR